MNSCETEISGQQLEELKYIFSNHLSPRRVSYITDINQLIRVLYKQNVIDSFRCEPLLDIKNHLGISLAALQLITKDVFVDYEPDTNNYAIQRLRGADTLSDKLKFNDLPFERHKKQIFKIINEQIGKKWKDLGRELDILEGKLDKIELENPNISDRIYRILTEFEEQFPPYERSAKLIDALQECGRRDLAKKISDIERRL